LQKRSFAGILAGVMKNRLGLVILAVLCLGLGVGLFLVSRNAASQKRADTERIYDFSNRLVTTSKQLDEQRQVGAELQNDLQKQRNAYGELTNQFTRVAVNLSETKATLVKTEDSLKQTQQEVARRDDKIAELENQNQLLDRRAVDLSMSITNLTVQIADTQRKLSASEGDKAFLEKELRRLMSEKAELERQFNDLKVLRAQVAKLKEELNVARRIEWIRKGLFANTDQKGAQRLMQGFGASQESKPKGAQDLNVEVSTEGTVKIVPPASTNTPPAK
jgi:chromosome segregation ATPase